MTPLSNCVTTPTGLVSWWRAESNAVDLVGSNNGQLQTGAGFGPGQVGTAFNFDGISSKVDLGDPLSLAFTNSFSIEGWIWVRALPPPGQGHGLILFRGDPRFCLDPYYLSVEADGSLLFHIEDAQDSVPCGVDLKAASIATNQWLHVAGIFDADSGSMQVYVNGQLEAQTNTAVRPFQNLVSGGTSIGNLSVGQNGMSFNGLIDELSVYNRALSSNEVEEIYGAAGAGKCTGLFTCSEPPQGLVAWWKADGNSNDTVGGNNGVLKNGTSFDTGEVGAAFEFNGTNQYVEIPDSPVLDPTNALTLEGWVYVTGNPNTDLATIVTKFSPSDGQLNQYQLETHYAGGRLNFRSLILLPSGYAYVDGNTSIQLSTWYHVAMTYDGTALKLFVNGALDGSVPASGSIAPTSEPLRIGGPGSGPWWFKGRVDELSLYSRALSLAEVQSIYSAGAAGKCVRPIAPSIVLQPQSQTATVGSTASFSVAAAGTTPLSYQWWFSAAPLSGATTSSLVLSNVSQANAGAYSVVITNSLGSITSSVATLMIALPTASIQVVNSSAAADGTVIVPVNLVANGNENAVSFSLRFDPTLLTYTSAALGSGAAAGNLLLNTSQAASGQVGVAVALPTGTSFAAGTQQVVTVSFTSPILGIGTNSTVGFADSPIKQLLTDALGSVLPSTFVSGQVLLPATALEGDVFPRPNGDETLTISDWVLVGRYVAGLDSPTNGLEFQRADCAPRSTLGDGALTVSDWVQAGRYAAGLDPVTRIGGPTSPVPMVVTGPLVTPVSRRTESNPRQVRASSSTTLGAGQVGTVQVALEAQGNENALAFSLAFDPTKLVFCGIATGNGATGTTLNVNTNQAAQGRLGVVLALKPNQSFAAGSKQLVQVNFRATSAAAATAQISFADQPVVRGICDPAAASLSAQYVDAAISLSGLPSLKIVASGSNLSLSWPASAAGFVLQESSDSSFSANGWKPVSGAPVVTNGEAVVLVPAGATSKFYRLYQP